MKYYSIWLPSRPWEKENHLQNAIFGGYVSSLQGRWFPSTPPFGGDESWIKLKWVFPKMVGFPNNFRGFSLLKMISTGGVKWGCHHLRKHLNVNNVSLKIVDPLQWIYRKNVRGFSAYPFCGDLAQLPPLKRGAKVIGKVRRVLYIYIYINKQLVKSWWYEFYIVCFISAYIDILRVVTINIHTFINIYGCCPYERVIS